MNKVLKTLEALASDIEWDNWINEGDNKHWKVSQVLYCKLDWVLEELVGRNDVGDLDEHIATLVSVQEVIEALQELEPQND